MPKYSEDGTLELDFDGNTVLLRRLGSAEEDPGSADIAGRYDCDGMLDWLELSGSGNSYISFMGIKEIAATYEIDGNRVIVTANGKNEVFTRSGDTLNYGKMSTCTKSGTNKSPSTTKTSKTSTEPSATKPQSSESPSQTNSAVMNQQSSDQFADMCSQCRGYMAGGKHQDKSYYYKPMCPTIASVCKSNYSVEW